MLAAGRGGAAAPTVGCCGGGGGEGASWLTAAGVVTAGPGMGSTFAAGMEAGGRVIATRDMRERCAWLAQAMTPMTPRARTPARLSPATLSGRRRRGGLSVLPEGSASGGGGACGGRLRRVSSESSIMGSDTAGSPPPVSCSSWDVSAVSTSRIRGRSALSYTSRLCTKLASWSETVGAKLCSAGGSRKACWPMYSRGISAINGGRPATISKSISPSA